jgi:WD40 repeat protein
LYCFRLCSLKILILQLAIQISALLNVEDQQAQNDIGRTKDEEELIARLDYLQLDHNRLLRTLDAQQSNFRAIMASLQHHLQQQSLDENERQFYSNSLRCISGKYGPLARLESWTITPYEVELGLIIGTGGFGEVYQGSWNKMPVAIRVLKSDAGIIPNLEVIRREINTWSMILHPHVLEFLGANVLDEKPFIVMPYLENRNARDFLQKHPRCDRLMMLHHISLGIAHLHSKNIIHGDIKGMNVLINDVGKAVLCDFGLSNIKADAIRRTTTHELSNVGSQNWMSPERLMGGTPRKPCDIYALGMTIFEIYTNDVPLGYINPRDFTLLVAERDVRPERPSKNEAPQLTDAVWHLANKCWVKNPARRPDSNAVRDTIWSLRDIQEADPPAPAPHLPSPSTSLILNPLAHTTLLRLTHADLICCAVFSPDGKKIVSSSADGTLRVWDALTGEETQPARCEDSTVISVGFSPDGNMIVFGTRNDIRILHAHNLRILAGPFQQGNSVYRVLFFHDGAQILFSAGRTVRVINALTGHLAFDIAHRDYVTAVDLSPDGERIASGSDGDIRIWDARTGNVLAGPFKGHPGISDIAFSPNGKCIVSCSNSALYDRTTIIVWDVGRGNVVTGPFGYLGSDSTTNCLAFSPDGKSIVSGASRDNKIRVWDAVTGDLLRPTSGWGNGDFCHKIAFSRDGKQVMAVMGDKTIYIGHWRDL